MKARLPEPTAPLLTIGIPAAQRCGALVRLLDGIARERRAAGGLPELEVLVSDDASADGTERELAARARGGELRHQRQGAPLGAERHLESVLRGARGEYVWLLEADSQLDPGALPPLLERLRRERPALALAAERRPGPGGTAQQAWATRSGAEPLGALLGEFGLFGLLAPLGRAVFRRAALRGLQLFFPLHSGFAHVFVLAHCFARERAALLGHAAWIAPEPGAAAAADAHGEHWLRCMQAVLRLLECGALPSPLAPAVFRMGSEQPWPLHHHVYGALAQQLFARGARLAPREWQELARFDALLGAAGYTRRLEALRQASALRELSAQFCLELCREPEPLFAR